MIGTCADDTHHTYHRLLFISAQLPYMRECRCALKLPVTRCMVFWHIQVFFCKYNDPLYVKMEKLEVMIRLASEKNIDQVLLEFKEYAQEVDVDFVRKVRRWRAEDARMASLCYYHL